MQILCYVYAFSVVSKTNFQSFFLDFGFFFSWWEFFSHRFASAQIHFNLIMAKG